MTQQPSTGMVPEFTISDRLRKAREFVGMEQGPFADLIGVSRGTVSNYERGQMARPPKPIVLRAWAMATGVSYEWLVDGEAGKPTPPGPGGGKQTPELEALTRAKRDKSRSIRRGASTPGYLGHAA